MPRARRFLWLLLAPLAGAGFPPELRDQHGASASLDDGLGAAQVVMVVSARRLRRLKPWERALREEFGDVPLLRVASVPQTAPTSHDRVAEILRRRLPPEVAVLIDLKGVWAERYQLDTRVPNVLVFDPGGALHTKQAGMFQPRLFEALAARARPLLSGATTAPGARHTGPQPYAR